MKICSKVPGGGKYLQIIIYANTKLDIACFFLKETLSLKCRPLDGQGHWGVKVERFRVMKRVRVLKE